MRLPDFTLRGFKPPREALDLGLGDLEHEILELLWARGGETSVREVWNALGARQAYTTVMTTLDRLHRKALLERRMEGRAFVYWPRVSRDEFAHAVTKGVVEELLAREEGGVGDPVLTCIVEAVSERDRALLDELERLILKRKRLLDRKED